MAWVDTFLFRGLIRHKMRDELVPCQSKRQRLFRSPPDSTTKTIYVEPDGRLDIVNWKGEMEKNM
jgi:hypothetical protein